MATPTISANVAYRELAGTFATLHAHLHEAAAEHGLQYIETLELVARLLKRDATEQDFEDIYYHDLVQSIVLTKGKLKDICASSFGIFDYPELLSLMTYVMKESSTEDSINASSAAFDKHNTGVITFPNLRMMFCDLRRDAHDIPEGFTKLADEYL